MKTPIRLQQIAWTLAAFAFSAVAAAADAPPGKPLFIIYKPGELRVTASVPQYRMQQMRKVIKRAAPQAVLDAGLDGQAQVAHGEHLEVGHRLGGCPGM